MARPDQMRLFRLCHAGGTGSGPGPAERAELVQKLSSDVIEAYKAGLLTREQALEELKSRGKSWGFTRRCEGFFSGGEHYGLVPSLDLACPQTVQKSSQPSNDFQL